MVNHYLLNDVGHISEFVGGPGVSNNINFDKRHAGVAIEKEVVNVRFVFKVI